MDSRTVEPSHVKFNSMAKQFTRNYLLISLIPLMVLFILGLTGATVMRDYFSRLIVQSTSDLNTDAEHHLQLLGEQLIRTKARDVAKEIEIYFRMHPDQTLQEMRRDPYFMALAIQKVGKTGYTAITESGSLTFRVHPNTALNDQKMHQLAKKLPDWWKIIQATADGSEVSGYYDWIEPDGTVRKKFLAFSPVKFQLHGHTMMVAATTYIDEFSAPVASMEKRAGDITTRYQRYVTHQWILFGTFIGLIILLTLAGTYFLSRRTALRYILPMTQLADSVRELGEGKWEIGANEALLHRNDEIGTLAKTFNGMSVQLKDLFGRLELRVKELKQTQEALKASEADLRSLFNGVPVGLYRTSPEGAILDANPTLAQMLRYPDMETFLCCKAEDLYVAPEDRAVWQRRVAGAGAVQTFETRMRRYDGSTAWIEDQSRAVRDDRGRVRYYEGSLQDITERKNAEAALKQSEERYRSLYEASEQAEAVYRSLIHSSADAIAICDLEGRVSYVSPMFSQIFEWSSEELIGHPLPFVPESEKTATDRIFQQVIENGTPCHGFETKRLTKSNRVIDVSISASRYDDHAGQPAGILVIVRDVSKQKRLESQLQHAARMEAIGTLAGGIAHDFNNLLMVIQGSATLLKQNQNLAPADPGFAMLANIEKEVQRGSRLTSQLLGYARKGRYEIKPLNLNEIVRESTETLRRTRKDITIELLLDPDLRPVEADIYQIEQALMNLYVNASDAMPDGGHLRIRTGNVSSDDLTNRAYRPKPGTYALLQVEDNGIGMSPQTMERIFDPFFTTKEMGRGTGLGLSSVYGIVKGHGGYIDVDSEEGRRTAFSLYLPVSDKAIERSPVRTQAPVSGEGCILLIDDEALVLDVGARILRTLGYEVITAESGREAIEIFAKDADRIDLTILDMIMPDLSGGQSFDRLKEIDPSAKIMLSSGYSIEGKATDIMLRGCAGFIQKPYTVGQLATKIAAILNNGT